MLLKELLSNIDYELVRGDLMQEVLDVQYDSRSVGPGSLFVCVKGYQTDGHRFASQAVSNGASVVVAQDDINDLDAKTTIVKTPDTREALALIAAHFYGNPSDALNLIGVTGTNGKTTTTYLIRSVLEHIGRKTGVIGTIGNMIGDRKIHADRTTPESADLQKLFAQMKKEGVQDVAMEVSSHSLVTKRVYACTFAVGVFTNLTEDHLDFHKTMENYRDAKALLFDNCRTAAINIDDPYGEYMLSRTHGKVLTFGIDNPADIQANTLELHKDSVAFRLSIHGKNAGRVVMHTPGRFSIYNALGAICSCILLGFKVDDIIEGIAENEGVPGRFQTITSNDGISAIIDYAHTPDALENILKTARGFATKQIITVFGCGGDRDRSKRSIMGEIAGKLSDICVITSDNPRTENPNAIIDQIEAPLKAMGARYLREPDRAAAIKAALSLAQTGDIVIVAGKGHEDYQIFANKTIHFDDAEIVRACFGLTEHHGE